jgi:hypothetical protein
MRRKTTNYLLMAAAVLLLVGATQAWAGGGSQCSQHGHQAAATENHHSMAMAGDAHHQRSESGMMDMSATHGGTMQSFGKLQFETVFTEKDVRLYVTSADGTPADLKGLSGTATITNMNDKSTTVKLNANEVSDDDMASHRHMMGMSEPSLEYLAAPFGFGTLPDKAVSVAFALDGVKGVKGGKAEWTQALAMTPLFGVACPMHPEQASLTDGKCSICGGMQMQPAKLLYSCCPACPDMRSTTPTTCQKCGMEMKLKSVGQIKVDQPQMKEMRHPDHAG